MSNSAPNVSKLFQSAHDAGDLTAASMQALNISDLGAQIQDALGMPALDVQASEVFLLGLLLDDSSSVRFVKGNSEAVCQGHNEVLRALRDSKQDDSILVHSRYLNGRILYPFCTLAQAIEMTSANYNPNGGTPLYEASVSLLGTMLAKAQEFADNGVPVRTASLIVTDGNDESDRKKDEKDVSTIALDMQRRETHIIGAMGINDGHTDFRSVFHSMGIQDQWILTPGNTPSEIRKAFGAFSKSAVRASQSAQSFSQSAMGGFGSP